ncbi:hypothetical protein F5888DRAFT_1615230 [Russula emetica]|nr:hypothetical protein F5888DRAFT_1615230 [Russula emetica]
MLWNDCVEEATRQPPGTLPLEVLRLTRFLYIGLHQGTDAAPTHFSASTPDFYHILSEPQSYPLCNIQDHRPDSIPSTSSPTLPGNPIAGNPIAHPVGGSRSSGIAPAPQDITSTATSFYPLGGNKQEDIISSWVITDIGRISFTVSTSSLALASAAPVLNKPSASHDVYSPSTSKYSLPASSIISVPPPSHIPPMPNAELLSLGGTSSSSPLDNAMPNRFRARGLINEGNMCFVNAALQLLVYCPPFWDQFRDKGRLMDQHGQGGGQRTGGRTTLLMDSTIRLLNEFLYKKPLLTQQSLQLANKRKAREDERRIEDEDTDPFLPKYVYDAMKEKRQLKRMLDGRQQDAEEFFCAYLDALDEELLGLLNSISTHRTTSAALKVEEVKERSQSDEGQTEVERRDYIVDAVKSPSRIFDGKFRTTVCTAGQPDIVTVEGRRSLQLDIQPDSVHTVQDALAHISRPQVGPSGPSTGEVTVLIEALPPVLVLHLKRFSYDAATGGVVKNSKPVQLSSELEIPPDIMAPGAGQAAWPARYTLYGVLYHHGKSAGGGHYTVDVLHPNSYGDNGDVWLHIDDETVSTLRHEDVFGRHDDERADDRCAYLLFYRRTAFPQT